MLQVATPPRTSGAILVQLTASESKHTGIQSPCNERDTEVATCSTVRRGLRLLNSRQQVLIQDEINTSATSQWRMHTNATISYSNGNRVANLALGGQTMTATIMDSALDITFETLQPV